MTYCRTMVFFLVCLLARTIICLAFKSVEERVMGWAYSQVGEVLLAVCSSGGSGAKWELLQAILFICETLVGIHSLRDEPDQLDTELLQVLYICLLVSTYLFSFWVVLQLLGNNFIHPPLLLVDWADNHVLVSVHFRYSYIWVAFHSFSDTFPGTLWWYLTYDTWHSTKVASPVFMSW